MADIVLEVLPSMDEVLASTVEAMIAGRPAGMTVVEVADLVSTLMSVRFRKMCPVAEEAFIWARAAELLDVASTEAEALAAWTKAGAEEARVRAARWEAQLEVQNADAQAL